MPPFGIENPGYDLSMIWYSVDEETPLDTLNRPSLWLSDGEQVIQGGYVEASPEKKKQKGYWFDLNFQPLKGVGFWREIMPEDIEAPKPPGLGDQNTELQLPKGRG